MRQYQLVAVSRKTGKEILIGSPDTHKRICKFKWAQNEHCKYNYYEIKKV